MFRKLQKIAFFLMAFTAGVISTALAQTKVDTITPASGKLLPAALKP